MIFYIHTLQPQQGIRKRRGAGGLPVFGRTVNPISTMGGRLCPPQYDEPPPGFSGLATALQVVQISDICILVNGRSNASISLKKKPFIQFFRWKCQRNFTLGFMRKFGMSRFNDAGTSKVENKIVACIEEFLSSK